MDIQSLGCNWGCNCNCTIYGGLSPEPPSTPTQAIGAGIYRMVE